MKKDLLLAEIPETLKQKLSMWRKIKKFSR